MTSGRAGCTLQLLGPFEVRVDGRPAGLAGKPAALLALLVLDAPAPVSTERLIDALWGDDPPRTGRKSVHVHVSRLRKALPDGLVVSEGDGYALRLGSAVVDVRDFRALVAEGRRALEAGDVDAAAATLGDGLALWRGPALGGLRGEPATRAHAERLDEERLAALELRVEADLRRGRHTEVAGELQALVADHPYREAFWRQLMLALYRAGRQADALAAYRDARHTLASELGLEPSPELRELEAAILRQDEALARPPSVAPWRRPRTRWLAVAVTALAALAVAIAGAILRRSDQGTAPPAVRADSLVQLDPASGEVVSVTPVGVEPGRLAIGPGGVWVVNSFDRTVTRVAPDGSRRTVGAATNVDAIAVDRSSVWVSGFDRPTIARIDGETLRLESQIGVPAERAEGLAVGGGSLWVTNPTNVRAGGGDTITRVDLRTSEPVSTVAVGKTPLFLTFGLGAVWVSNYDDDTVSVVAAGSRRAETIRACNGPLGIATGAGAVWVVCYWSRVLARIDPTDRRVVQRARTGAGPLAVAVGAGAVWVTNREDRTVVKMHPRTLDVLRTVRFPAGAVPYEVVVGRGAVWVTTGRCARPPCDELEAPASG